MILNKVCEVADFSDNELSAIMLHSLPRPPGSIGSWPRGQEDRKFWEIAMALLAAMRHVPTNSRRKALGVGAGIEATSFILTSTFEQVFATDKYGCPDWEEDAPAAMLVTPEHYAGDVPFFPEKLFVQHMDGRDLQYADNTFDFVYSSSSLEHFGSPSDMAVSMSEMARVLRPGGILSLSTEFSLSGGHHWLGSKTFLFDEHSIESLITFALQCELVDTPCYDVSAATRLTSSDFKMALQELRSTSNRLERLWSKYPHILISHKDLLWTSVHICLRKGIPTSSVEKR